jgi:nucleoid-associated protein YgaU
MAGCYVVAVTLLQLLAAALGSRSLASFATLVTAPALTSLLVIGSVAPALAEPAPAATSDRLVELPTNEQPPPTAILHLLSDAPPPSAVPTPPTAPTSTTAPAPAPTARTADNTWTVAPGDSFWSIASDALHDARGHEPADDEVLPYWQALVAANHDILVVPGNADLLFPGQVVTLLPIT